MAWTDAARAAALATRRAHAKAKARYKDIGAGGMDYAHAASYVSPKLRTALANSLRRFRKTGLPASTLLRGSVGSAAYSTAVRNNIWGGAKALAKKRRGG